MVAPDLAHLFVRKLGDVFTLEDYLASGDFTGFAYQIDERKTEHGFTGTGFTDNSEAFTFVDSQAYITHGPDCARSQCEVYPKIINIYEWFHSLPLVEFGVKEIPDPIAQKIDDQNQEDKQYAGEDGDPPRTGENVFEPGGDQ